MFTVLIVDDEPYTRSYLMKKTPEIDESWSTIGEAADGAEALDFLKSNKVDLVITDIKMPVMNGIAFSEKIRQVDPLQEIIILSGYDDFSYAQEVIKHKVHGYLLKPIKIDELKQTLCEVREKLSKRKKQELDYLSLTESFNDYKGHICRSYLRAIIGNSYTEIQSLQPILYKVKADIILSHCTVLLLRPDIYSMIESEIPIKDINILRYILLQGAKEMIEELQEGFVFLDSEENVVVYLTSDDRMHTEETGRSLFAKISDFMEKNTGVSLTGCMGVSVDDVLELNTSYSSALTAIGQYVFLGSDRLFEASQMNKATEMIIEELSHVLITAFGGAKKGDEHTLGLSLKQYVDNMKEFTPSAAKRFGIHILYMIKRYERHELSNDQFMDGLRCIMEYTDSNDKEMKKEKIHYLFMRILKAIWNQQDEGITKNAAEKLVDQAKEFIINNFSEQISLSQMAEFLRVSPSFLSKTFHEVAGETYIKYITRVRMEYAVKLLVDNPNEKVAVIAEKCGYYNWKHFNYVFKEYYNVTPVEYKKNSKCT